MASRASKSAHSSPIFVNFDPFFMPNACQIIEKGGADHAGYEEWRALHEQWSGQTRVVEVSNGLRDLSGVELDEKHGETMAF